MEYKKCLVELDEILKYLSEEDLKKIPYEIRNAIKEEKDNEYIWNYNEAKELNEQNINRKTIAMLSYLNMEYLLDKEQKSIMEKLHKFNEEKIEKEKIKKYNPNDMFKSNTDCYIENKNINKNKEVTLIKTAEEKWYRKILDFFRDIFKR